MQKDSYIFLAKPYCTQSPGRVMILLLEERPPQNERLRQMFNDVTITVTESNAKLLQKFAKAEEAKITRQLNRLQNKINSLYNLKYDASDFAYMIEGKLDDLSRY